MSGHKYISDSDNLFSDDIDDDTFLKNSRPRPTNNYNNYSSNDPLRRIEEQRQTLLEKKKEIEERTINSTQRSLGLLRDSEQVGIATAEELSRQREQLERTDKRLDEINSTLRFSQKHLNGIKSVFGSLKNYLSGRNEVPPNLNAKSSGPSTSASENKLNTAPYAREDSYNNHPLARMRSEDTGHSTQQYQRNGDNLDAQAIIDANLGEMLNNVVKLKGLAFDMSSEIDSQNDLIDNISMKTDKADLTIVKQNKDMNKILKKK